MLATVNATPRKTRDSTRKFYFVGNMLTKYQTIKFIDFCEVWFLPESVATHTQGSRHCWRSPLPPASVLIQRDFGCVLGVQLTKQLPHVAKVDLVWHKYGVVIWVNR
ncbi:hypothetical protein TNCV_1292901 [Trichonephila clavipes]|nr:hypothetical protein TNCV_1292901 [Trichonephila clavipes]